MRKTTNTKKRVKKSKVKLTPEQKKQKAENRKKVLSDRKFRIDIKTVFKNASFDHIPTKDIQFTFKDKTTEFDNIFIYENIVVVVEDTCSTKSEDIRDHILKKKDKYKFFQENKDEFVVFLENTFERFKELKNQKYDPSNFKLLFVYCSKNRFEEKYKIDFPEIIFLDYRFLCYFLSLAKTIHKSVRFELFKFLRLKIQDIGTEIGKEYKIIQGSVLPESPSGFPSGYKVITFYIDPATLIKLSYVMRKDGWLADDSLYQRMLTKNKIISMREYLAKENRVFINNIIVTLPPSTKLNKDENTIQLKKLTKTEPIEIQIPIEYNSIGIVDGQHRVFAYHEGSDQYESEISIKREKQNLLITGIIYPNSIDSFERTKFEAKLFLEINDKQKKAKAELKQTIEVIVNPFSVIAISKSIISKLSNTGPLTDMLEVYSFDKGKIKTASIVSYGLRHIVKLDGKDSLFKIWDNSNKNLLQERNNKDILDNYIDFCVNEINKILIALKINLSKDEMWILNNKISRVLTTTSINGIIYCLRRIISEKNKTYSIESYTKKISNLKIDFSPKRFKYKSSHWKDLGDDIYNQCFS